MVPSGVSRRRHRAAELLQARFAARLQRMAEGIVRRDEVPLLAVLAEQRGQTALASICVVLQTRKTFQWQLAGDRVGVAAGDDVQDVLLVRHLGHRERQRRVDVAEQEVDLVALDQLARLLHRGAGVAAGRVLDQQLDLAAEDAALGVDLLDRQRQPICSFLPSSA